MRILIIGGCGYVGSALYRHLTSAGYSVDTMDREDRGNFVNPNNIRKDYRNPWQMSFGVYDTIIHLAGHSSVGQCVGDPYGAIDNNLTGMIGFVKRLSTLPSPPKLLWASSGSILSTETEPNVYDATKRCLEAVIPMLYPRSIGLRFGTVCGVSDNMRHDLMLNAMARSAVVDGAVKLRNPDIRRPILGINDLCRSVRSLVGSDFDKRNSYPESVNLCSFNTDPGSCAAIVARNAGAKVQTLPDSLAYDFEMTPDPHATQRETLESITCDLIKHYRSQQLAEAVHRV